MLSAFCQKRRYLKLIKLELLIIFYEIINKTRNA